MPDFQPNPKPGQLGKNTLSGIVGNVLEWYDFALFGYFTPLFGELFFPSSNKLVSLLSAFGVFAGAYFMRPFGGMVFGYIGDRFGRKKALQISVMMMAVPTSLIGLLPTHAQIGGAAAVLLVLLRLVQGLSVGGELVASISYLTEIAPAHRRGFIGSWVQSSSICGVMFGSLVAMFAHNSLSPSDLQAWGWRLPFMAGLAIGGVALWMRQGLEETPVFEKIRNTGNIAQNPVKNVIVTMPGRIFHVAALVMLSGGGFYILFVWWPTLLSGLVDPPIRDALRANTLSMFVLMLLVPIGGWLSDIYGRVPVLVASSLGLAIAAHPLFVMVGQGTFAAALTAQLVFVVFMAGFTGPIPATLFEMFPSRTRFSGIALGYNISLCAFGGTAPLVCTWIISRTGDISAPALYLSFLAIVSLLASVALTVAVPSFKCSSTYR